MLPGNPPSGSRRSQASEGCKNKECPSSLGGTRAYPPLTCGNGSNAQMRNRVGSGLVRILALVALGRGQLVRRLCTAYMSLLRGAPVDTVRACSWMSARGGGGAV